MQEFVCSIGFGERWRRTSLEQSGCVCKCFWHDEQRIWTHGERNWTKD